LPHKNLKLLRLFGKAVRCLRDVVDHGHHGADALGLLTELAHSFLELGRVPLHADPMDVLRTSW